MHNEPRDAHKDNQRHDGAARAADCSGSGACAFGARPHRHLRLTSLTRPHAHSTRLTPSGSAGVRPAAPSSTAQSTSIDGSSAEPSGATFSPSSASARAMMRRYLRSQSTDVVSGSTDAAWGAGVAGADARKQQATALVCSCILTPRPHPERLMLSRGAQSRYVGASRTARLAVQSCVRAEVRGWAHRSFAA